MGKMTVYHGSYTVVKEPKIVTGKNTKDFGTGFYCTIIREQAERWAKFKYPTHQVNFCTRESLQCLKYMCSEEVYGDR